MKAPGWLFDLAVDVLPLVGFGVGLSFLEDVAWKEAIVSFAAVTAYLDAARLRRRLAAVTSQLNATTAAVNGITRTVDRVASRGGGS